MNSYDEMTEAQRRRIVDRASRWAEGRCTEDTYTNDQRLQDRQLIDACQIPSLLPTAVSIGRLCSVNLAPAERQAWIAGFQAAGPVFLKAAETAVDHTYAPDVHHARSAIRELIEEWRPRIHEETTSEMVVRVCRAMGASPRHLHAIEGVQAEGWDITRNDSTRFISLEMIEAHGELEFRRWLAS